MNARVITAAMMLCATACGAPPGDERDWKRVFGDEFEGSSLDIRKWSYDYPWGPIHNHMAYMDRSHVRVAGGKLVIRALNERHPKATDTAQFSGRTLKVSYQAGAVHTSGKFDFTHGYAEARLKVPKGRGYWPAFWLLPTAGGWPPEIDVMEILTGDPHRSHVALHYGKNWQNHHSHGRWVDGLTDLSADFHNYGVHWTPNFIDFYFDGKRVHRVSDLAAIAHTDTPMYLIINLAVGGWEKSPDETTVWNRNFYEVDWVRVWQSRQK